MKLGRALLVNVSALRLWEVLSSMPMGAWLFVKILCFKAPYFASISPRIQVLEKNRCQGSITQQRRIQNHLGGIHAIALCNLAELCAGLMTDSSIPEGMRWIPKGMNVIYQKKALGTITAEANLAEAFYWSETGYAAVVNVSLFDESSSEVFRAEIHMWLSQKNKKS